MSDINIEDFIHGARTFQDEYNDIGYSAASDRQLADFIDEALTLARSYDKLLRELDVANRTSAAKPFDMWTKIGTIANEGLPIGSYPAVGGTVWEVATAMPGDGIASASEDY
jgi:hypothetical protein